MTEDFNHLRDGKDIVIITIAGQIEGFAAAWIANRILVRQAGLKVRWFALDPKKPFPITRDQVRDAHVRLIGLGCSRVILDMLHKEAASIFLYDNDFETKNKVGGLRFVKIDLKKSPARLFWNELRTTMQIKVEQTLAVTSSDTPTAKVKKTLQTIYFENAPWLVDYVEKKEFWPWSGLNPISVRAGIKTFKEDFDKWDDLSLRDIGDVARIGSETFKDPRKLQAAAAMTARKATDKNELKHKGKFTGGKRSSETVIGGHKKGADDLVGKS